jgi:hypothetical protein
VYNRELNGKVVLITFDDNSLWMTTKRIEEQVCAVQSVGAVGVILTMIRVFGAYDDFDQLVRMTRDFSSASAIPVLMVPHSVCKWLGANDDDDDDDDDVGRAVGVFKTVVFQPGQ